MPKEITISKVLEEFDRIILPLEITTGEVWQDYVKRHHDKIRDLIRQSLLDLIDSVPSYVNSDNEQDLLTEEINKWKEQVKK